MIAVLLWYSLAAGSGMPRIVPTYGISTNGGSKGNRDLERSTTAENEETSKSLTDSTRIRVDISWFATRDMFCDAPPWAPPVNVGPPADSVTARVDRKSTRLDS